MIDDISFQIEKEERLQISSKQADLMLERALQNVKLNSKIKSRIEGLNSPLDSYDNFSVVSD